MTKAKHTLNLKRRRQKKTDYKKRLALLKSKKTRLVVRISNKQVRAQLVNYSRDGDETIVSANSNELNKFGFMQSKNIPASYLTGYLLGKKGLKNKVKEAILDTGLRVPVKKGRLFAVQKGAIDAGLRALGSAEEFPSEERISGKDIEGFAQKLSGEEFKRMFGGYKKKGFDVKHLSNLFKKTKEEIDKKFSEKSGSEK